MWKASRAPVQKGLKIRDPTSPHSGTLIWVLGCPPLTSYRTLPKLFNLVSLSFYFYKMGVRRAHSSPQFVDHKSPAGGSCLQLSHVNVCLGLGGVGRHICSVLLGPSLPVQRSMGWPLGTKSTVYPGRKGRLLSAGGGGYVKPCARPSQSRGLVLLCPQPACGACPSLPVRVRDLRLRRVESFFRVANSTEPGLPDQKQEQGLEGVLVLPSLCSPQPHASLPRPWEQNVIPHLGV